MQLYQNEPKFKSMIEKAILMKSGKKQNEADEYDGKFRF